MISIIAAVAKNGVIGCNGHIPWNYPEDMAYFRQITTGGIVIMGRYTYEEIGKPLPDRFNIIVSQHRNFSGKHLQTVQSIENAISLAKQYAAEHQILPRIFLCGGQKIYAQGMKYADRLYLTEIDAVYSGDVFFPEFTHSQFQLVKQTSAKTAGMRFCIYEAVHKN